MIVLTAESCRVFTKIKYAEVLCKLPRPDLSFASVRRSGAGQRGSELPREPLRGGVGGGLAVWQRPEPRAEPAERPGSVLKCSGFVTVAPGA